MDFGKALEALRAGRRVQRAGWNGKGMWIALQRGYPDGIPINRNTSEATGFPEGTVCRFAPYLMLRTAQGDFVPWTASQTDVLAEDWGIARDGVTANDEVHEAASNRPSTLLGAVAEWKAASERGKCCGVFGCPEEVGLSVCAACRNHYCHDHLAVHFHVAMPEDVPRASPPT